MVFRRRLSGDPGGLVGFCTKTALFYGMHKEEVTKRSQEEADRIERYWREYREHDLSLTDYWCGDCGMVRLKKAAGEPPVNCDKCRAFREGPTA